ncbi:hypothetical protein [Cetobacterium sp.]|uniref:hypothetical protein n=1 Tax=Cetobacterium sp. TaxID=2071632 RepID=UPI003F411979
MRDDIEHYLSFESTGKQNKEKLLDFFEKLKNALTEELVSIDSEGILKKVIDVEKYNAETKESVDIKITKVVGKKFNVKLFIFEDKFTIAFAKPYNEHVLNDIFNLILEEILELQKEEDYKDLDKDLLITTLNNKTKDKQYYLMKTRGE